MKAAAVGARNAASAFVCTAYPKVSLVGHPSDGFGGGTVGLTIADFRAEVTATSDNRMSFTVDAGGEAFQSGPKAMADHLRRYGYDGSIRLMRAALVRFVALCEARGIALPEQCCELSLHTTIPRQIGMGGSSAIVRAALDALAAFYGVAVAPRDRVAMALEVETVELGIQAGLMDRVAQVYDGVVHLQCPVLGWTVTRIDERLLPQLFLAFRPDLAKQSSGGLHSPLAARFKDGDVAVRDAMAALGALAVQARDDLLAGNASAFLRRMDEGMAFRRTLMPNIDARYFELVDIGRAQGAHVTFTGSGGAVAGSFENAAHFAALEKAYAAFDATIIAPTPTRPRL